jgi:hypothetical protein
MNPFLALIITFAVALIELRLLDFVAHRGWIESRRLPSPPSSR